MNYIIEATKNTPFVHISSDEKIIQIKGVSHPEHALTFYTPIIDQLKQLSESKSTTSMEMSVFMEYFNTSSAKCFFDIFKQIKRMKGQGMDIDIKWLYEEEDDDMMETGEDYDDILNLNIKFIEVPLTDM
ncbi:MAG: DUF1987 domain-containing protein [Cyclobacteriaceae bacterium]